MLKPESKEILLSCCLACGFVVAAFAVATAMAFSDARSHQELRSDAAGRYISTALNGSEGTTGAGLGVGIDGRAVVGTVSTASNLISLVRTDTQTLTVKGGFTDRVGDALLVVTMKDGTRFLCPSTKKNCRKIVDEEN